MKLSYALLVLVLALFYAECLPLIVQEKLSDHHPEVPYTMYTAVIPPSGLGEHSHITVLAVSVSVAGHNNLALLPAVAAAVHSDRIPCSGSGAGAANMSRHVTCQVDVGGLIVVVVVVVVSAEYTQVGSELCVVVAGAAAAAAASHCRRIPWVAGRIPGAAAAPP